MQQELWDKIWCPMCRTVNWVCLGDPEDTTAYTEPGLRCCGCRMEFTLPGFEEVEQEEMTYAEGKEAPTGYILAH